MSAQQDIASPLDFGLSRHSSIISLNKHHGKESPFHEYRIELQTNVREIFTITEKAPTRDFSWLKAPTGSFTFETLKTTVA